MGRRLELRDLRSLERRSLHSIFHRLDAKERLPRELIAEGKRHRATGVRYIEVIGALYLPLLILVVVVLGSIGVNMLVAFGVSGLLLIGFFIYALAGKYR